MSESGVELNEEQPLHDQLHLVLRRMTRYIMDLQIQLGGGLRGVAVPQDYRELFSNSLARFTKRIRSVHVFLDDVNGPKGGVDKQCRCVVAVAGVPEVVITDRDESLSSLLHRVANRVAFTVSQRLDRAAKRVNRAQKHSRLELDPLSNDGLEA
ncbi:MAG: hypothetical protein AAGG44_19725 [Planctomycetota bacterium]